MMISYRYYNRMMKNDSRTLRPLLDRLFRLSAADAWLGDLTPTQMAALDYLSRANRFSRAPSQVADFLGATRGTVSQTLKTLERKGLVAEHKSKEDKRRIRYDITSSGQTALNGVSQLGSALAELDADQQQALITGLHALLHQLVQTRGSRPFGLCRDCRYHDPSTPQGAFCRLLEVRLEAGEAAQICHEQIAAA